MEFGRRFALSATALGGGYYATFNENRLDEDGVAYQNQSGAAGYVTFLARAWDDRGNAQPIASFWNPLGYFWNGVHRVGVVVEA